MPPASPYPAPYDVCKVLCGTLHSGAASGPAPGAGRIKAGQPDALPLFQPAIRKVAASRWLTVVCVPCRHALVLTALSLLIAGLPSVAAAEYPFSAQIVFGYGEAPPPRWRGSIQADNTRIAEIKGYPFRNADRIDLNTFELHTEHPVRPQPARKGLIVRGSAAPGARINISTDHGNFSGRGPDRLAASRIEDPCRGNQPDRSHRHHQRRSGDLHRKSRPESSSLSYPDTDPQPGAGYYYVRVVQGRPRDRLGQPQSG